MGISSTAPIVSRGTFQAYSAPLGFRRGTANALEYNLRHAVEKHDEARMAACLTELFRHFVSLNIPMTRYAWHQLCRNDQLDQRMAIGPFANPISLGMHQRILTLLLGIVVRQIGIAAPTMTSHAMEQWKLYERVLFHRPALALARLIGIGVTLCHCKKDASVAYARHIFEDTRQMRDWRIQMHSNADSLKSFMRQQIRRSLRRKCSRAPCKSSGSRNLDSDSESIRKSVSTPLTHSTCAKARQSGSAGTS